MRVAHNSIPIISLWDTLLVSLQGDISDEQINSLKADVLNRIDTSNPTGLVIDVSGLHLLDSYLCGVIATIASSAKMMGVRSVVSGLSPNIAITLETMGVGFGNIHTTLNLEDALHSLGLRVVDVSSGAKVK